MSVRASDQPTALPALAHSRRWHLAELEDQPWLPTAMRDGATAFLELGSRFAAIGERAAPIVERALRRASVPRIVDLCSGAGGPLLGLSAALHRHGHDVEIVMSDRYPHRDAFRRLERASGGHIVGLDRSHCAIADPPELAGARTIFNGLHHFEPDHAVAILRGACRLSEPIAVFEIAERTLRGMATVLPAPLLCLLTTPLVRPLTWRQLALTYLVPAVPAVVLWDGIVSLLRSYTPHELFALGRLADGGYQWEVGHVALPPSPARLTYLLGVPATA